jgi:DNA-binding CsgD family transcriptional regulator
LTLVEREGELARVGSVLAAARSGTGSTLLIEGPPGIGKTSLLASARSTAARDAMRVLHARGSQLEREYAMGLVRQAFEPAIRAEADADRLFTGAAELARNVLVDVPSDAAAPVGVLHGLYWLTANMAARKPLLLAIDDAHWADEPSLRFLAYLIRRAESLPVALVIASRPADGADARATILGEIRDDPATESHQLRPLALAGVAGVLHELAEGTVDENFARSCHEATGGNPFLLSELVRALRAEGVPFTAADAARVGAFAPPTVARRVRTTLERLGPAARELARAVAVLGDGTELELAAELAGVEPAEAAVAVGELTRAGVFADATPLRFLHPLLFGALRTDIPAAERAAAHARAADLLRSRGTDAERIALQLMHAAPCGDSRAVADLREAAERARRRGAPATVVELLARALAEPPEAELRGHLLLELAQAEYAIGRTEDAAQHFEQAYRCTSSIGIRGRAILGLFQARAGRFSEQRAMAPLLEEALPEVLEHDRELGLRLLALKLLAIQPGDAMANAARGLEELPGDTPGEAIILGHLALPIVSRQTTAAEAAEIATRAARHADALLEEGATALVMTGMVLALWWAERLDAAQAVLERAIVVARRRGATGDFALAQQFRASVYRRAGRLRDAEADARSGLELAGGAGWAGAGARAITPLVGTLLDQGRVEDAAQELGDAHPQEEVLDSPAATDILLERMRLRNAQGKHREALADWDEARRRIQRHLSRQAMPYWVPYLITASESAYATGLIDEQQALLSEATALAEHWGAPGFIGEARLAASRLQTGEARVDLVRDAVEHLRRSPARLALAQALVSLGEVLRRRGERVNSREPLRDGYELAHECGAAALAERARAELRASGLRLQREARSGRESLTPSEQRIAEMAATGASNAEIAQALFLTVKTVEMHLTRAYRKLDVRGRSDLAAALAA